MRMFGAVSKQRIVFAVLLLIGTAAMAGGQYFAGATNFAAAPHDRAPVILAALGHYSALQFIDLTEKQVGSLKIGSVALRNFDTLKTAVGTIDFNENMLVQVFSQYPGKILKAFFNLGDEVKQGDVLFTIDSPDLLQAESNLLASAGVLELQKRTLARVTMLLQPGGSAQKDAARSPS